MNIFQKNYDMLLAIFNPEGWLEITYPFSQKKILSTGLVTSLFNVLLVVQSVNRSVIKIISSSKSMTAEVTNFHTLSSSNFE